jgi:hypothetical protein
MKTTIRTTVVATLVILSFVALAVTPSAASHPQTRLLPPEPDHCLPQFGFSSFNIAGVGERVTYVEWHGLASRIGLEPGDMILSMNGYRLNYHGSWNDALHRAMDMGGHVRLRIRDVRTGHVAFRQIYVGDGIGPVTPKYHVARRGGPNRSHMTHQGRTFENPFGPDTVQPKFGPKHGQDFNAKLKQIAKLLDE